MTAVHIIGAGLAGLSAALTLQAAGLSPRLYEAAPGPGGRCGGWSPYPGGTIRDRGTHLILAGNDTLCGLIRRHTPAEGWITLPPLFRFHDLTTGDRWTLHPGRGRWPGWLFSAGRRVPGVSAIGHLLALLALENRRVTTVGKAVNPASLIGRRLIAPLAVALLNTPAEAASLPLLRRTLHQSLYRGGDALSPLLCQTSLDHDLIRPLALAVTAAGGEIRLRTAVTGLTASAAGVTLHTPAGPVDCGTDPVILATDATQAHRLLPQHLPALPHSPILNLHYPLDDGRRRATPDLTGLCGGRAEWMLRRPGHLAVTISAVSDSLRTSPDLAPQVWQEARQIYPDLPTACPPQARTLTERRATLLQTPQTDALRPPVHPRTDGWPSTLWLSGDWVQTGLPCTLEGAARSGVMAADAIRQRISR